MNKTTNQYINQLNLDPKREAAVRKLVEGAGGVSDSTPLVESLVGDELIPINQDGENKAVRADELIKGGKEVFIITPDMFEQTSTTAGIQATLIFTDEGWSNFIEAIEANKIIVLDFEVGGLLLNTATPMVISAPNSGYFILTGLTYDSDNGLVRGFISFPSQTFESPAIYEITFEDKNVYSTIINTPSEIYIIDETMFTASVADEPISSFELTDEYKDVLARAISTNKVISISNLVLYYLVPSIESSNVNARGELFSGFSIINVFYASGFDFVGHVYYGYSGILLKIDCSNGIITVSLETMLYGNGDGTKFLADDGSYKEVSGGDNTFVATLSSKYADIKSAIDAKKQILFDDENGGIFTCNYSIFYSNIYLYYKGNYNAKEHPVTTFIKYESGGTIVGPYVADKTTIRRTISTNNANNHLIPSVYYIDTITANTRYDLFVSSVIYEQTGEAACFEGQIIFGSTVYTINFYINDSINSSSSNIKWSTDSVLEYKANHTYQFRIVNGLGVMKEFANA